MFPLVFKIIKDGIRVKMSNIKYNIVFIKEEYFKKNSNFEEMLDPYNQVKQTKRKYLYLNIQYKNNNIFIPFRNQLPSNKRIGEIGYSVPSNEKPNAGLDFRKILIINQDCYIEYTNYPKIPKLQQQIIENNYRTIENKVIQYIQGYVKAALKKRERRDKKYIFSTLHNFHKELGIIKILEAKSLSQNEVAVSKDE